MTLESFGFVVFEFFVFFFVTLGFWGFCFLFFGCYIFWLFFVSFLVWGVVMVSSIVVSTGFSLARDVGFLAGVSSLDFRVGDRVVLPVELVGSVCSFLGESGVRFSGLFLVKEVVWLGSGERVVVLVVCEVGVLSLLGGLGLV